MKDPVNPHGPAPDPADKSSRVPAKPTSRISIDDDSPYAEAATIYAACDQAHLAALDATATLFLADVIEHQNFLNPNPDFPYQHATFTDTARRFAAARACEDAGGEDSSSAESNSDETATDTVPANETAGDSTETATAPDQASLAPDPASLPGFPRFRNDQTFYGWVHAYSHTEDLAELSAIRGSSRPGTYTHITTAMTLIHGLPQFYQRCLDGDFTIEHALTATRMCKDIAFSHIPLIDDYLAARRADITIETFTRSLSAKIAVVQPAEDRTEAARDHRRVAITAFPMALRRCP